MSAFTIYFIVLTAAYLIYYAVIILRDLYGTKGKKSVDDMEQFDTDDSSPESEIHVTETEDGDFDIHRGDERFMPPGSNSAAQSDDLSDGIGDTPPSDVPKDDSSDESATVVNESDYESPEDSEVHDEMYRLAKDAQEHLDDVPVKYQHMYNELAYSVAMAQPLNESTKIIKKILSPHE